MARENDENQLRQIPVPCRARASACAYKIPDRAGSPAATDRTRLRRKAGSWYCLVNRSSHFQAICRTAAHSAEERTRCAPTRRAVALACSPAVGGRRVQRSTFRTIRLKPPREKQYDEYDQDDADYTDAAVTVTISIATKATAETTKQEDDKEDDEYESD